MSLWPFHHRHKRRNIAAVPQAIQGIQLSSAAAGLAIPIVYGQARCPGNLIHVKPRDTTIPVGSAAADLVDTLPIAMALCEGPIRGLGAAWADKESLDAATVATAFASGLYFVLFLGTSTQTPWAYLTSNYPAEAVPYQLTGYIVNRYWPSIKGASGGAFPNWAWEVLGLLPQGGGILDSNPKDVVNDFLTDANHGTLFPSALIDSSSLTQFATYCQAAGIFISPVVATQRPAAEHLQEWLAAANSAFVWSDGKLKIISYGDQAITGNGATFTPNVTPVYNLTDDDFIADGQDPVRVSRRPQSDVYNMMQVEFDNRAKGYNGDLAEAKDQASIELYGLKPAPVIKAPFIKEMAVARLVAQLALQRQVYIRNTYEFTLPFRYVLLEPMDLVTLTDSNLGLNLTTVRLTEVNEEEDGSFTCVAEEWPFGVATAAAYPISSSTGYIPNVPKAPDAPSPSISFDSSGQAILNIVGDASTVKHIYVLRTDRLPTLAETRAGSTSNFQSPSGIATGTSVGTGGAVYVGVLAYNVNGVESPLTTSIFNRGVAIYLSLRARVTATTPTTVTVRVALADPFPQGAGSGTLTYQDLGSGGVSPGSGGTVTPAATLTEAAGTFIDYTVTRPAFGAGAGRVTWNGAAANRVSDSDSVDIPEVGRDTVFLAARARVTATTPTTLTVRLAVADPYPQGANSATIGWQDLGSGGVSPATGQTVTPAASLTEAAGTFVDYTITRPAFGSGAGRVTFTVTAANRTSDSDAVDVPEADRDTQGLSVRVLRVSETATQIVARVEVISPNAGATVTIAYDNGGLTVTPSSGGTLTSTTSFGTTAHIDYTITRDAYGGTPRRVTFTASASGFVDATDGIDVAPVSALSLTLTIGTLLATNAGSTGPPFNQLEVPWTHSGMPSGTTFDISYDNSVSGGQGSTSGETTSPKTFTSVTFAASPGRGTVVVSAVKDGVVIAQKTKTGLYAT